MGAAMPRSVYSSSPPPSRIRRVAAFTAPAPRVPDRLRLSGPLVPSFPGVPSFPLPPPPCRRVLADPALGYLTLIRPGNVRTTRHVMHPPIVNFPNVVTSLRGVIRIPAGLVIVVDTRLSAGRIVPARSSLCFSAPAMRAVTCSGGVSACFACYRPRRGHRESIFSTFYPRRYLSRSARKRSLLYNSLFPIGGRGEGRPGQVH